MYAMFVIMADLGRIHQMYAMFVIMADLGRIHQMYAMFVIMADLGRIPTPTADVWSQIKIVKYDIVNIFK